MSQEGKSDSSAVKRALIEIRRLRDKLERTEKRLSHPIAVVGMGCRFPGGIEDPDAYWSLLQNGDDAITEIPADRWDVDAYFDPDPNASGKVTTRWGGFINDIDGFDPEFFGISAREACGIDPQQRLLLEVSWAALENAAISPDRLLNSTTGVFTGIGAFDYPQLELQQLDPESIDAYFATGSSHSIASGRLSYFLGLKGPTLSVDTACSSSLVAVHLACQSLRIGECDLALAGGVGVLLLPEPYIDFSRARMMAADGRCKTFDAEADGYVRSEGCGMVALKRLDDAISDRDRILGVIRGSAVNHDGRSSGITAPNGPSQTSVIRSALEQAGLKPEDVDYVETHGTGTSLGDPIEVQALAEVFARDRSDDHPLLIGSAKTNIGHLEAAAGVAGLIKLVQSIRHGAIPQSLNFNNPNPQIAWDSIPIEVASQATDWKSARGTRVGGVSSFGFSGTNAHVIVEQWREPDRDGEAIARPQHIVTLSAKNDDALRIACDKTSQALQSLDSNELANAAYTLNIGRAHFTHRVAVVGGSSAEISDQLARGPGPEIAHGVLESVNPAAVAFLFSGQGSQQADLGQSLFESAPVFRAAVEKCDAILEPVLSRPISAIMYASDKEDLARPRFAQPAIVTLEFALAELWRSWGIEPVAVAGHSLGEYAAAIVSKVLTLEDGLALVAERARLVDELCAPGRMLAVRASESVVRDMVAKVGGGTLSVAALNAAESVVVSGSADEVDEFARNLEGRSIHVQPLDTNRAYHGPLIEPVLGPLKDFAGTLDHASPAIPFVSTLTGRLFPVGEGPDAAYWAEQARSPVRFHAAVESLCDQPMDLFLEIGPASALTGIAIESMAEPADRKRWRSSFRRDRTNWEQLLDTASALYVQGARFDWRAFDAPYARQVRDMPGTTFQRKRYWFSDQAPGATRRTASLPRSEALWDSAVAAGQLQAQQTPIDLALDSYRDRWRALEDLCNGHSLSALDAVGFFEVAPSQEGTKEALRTLSILPMYESLVERWLKRLEKRGLVYLDEDRWTRNDATVPEQSEERANELFSDAPYVVDYLNRCGRLLSDVITGEESPLETLFPGGSRQTAVDLYRTWAMSRYFNHTVAAAISAVCANVPASDDIRIVEIGAGTGSTTASVLPVLPPDRTQYWFTDVSEFFFTAAGDEFSAYPFVEYGVFDIERSGEEQGFGRKSFHAAVAANVLHATGDLSATVDNVIDLLKPGGLLLLYEVTDPPAWIDTSVALIAGWAESSDGLRDDGPLLKASSWERLLRERGFTDVVVLPNEESPARVFGMSVIIARAPLDLDGRSSEPTVASSAVQSEASTAAAAPAFLEQLVDCLPDERRELLVQFVRDHVARVLRRAESDEPIGPRRSLMELGIDSLMALELRDRLGSGLGLVKSLPATLIFDYPNIESIADYVSKLIELDSDENEAESIPATEDQRAEEIGSMSDEEVESLLLERLDRKQ